MRIRKHFTYANVAMTAILVFAMSGGAYAAKHYLITSTKQISPTVLKQLAGKAGQQGPAGAPGPKGDPGAVGTKGDAGPGGTPGAEGKEGSEGLPGKDGKTGKEGSPWTAGGTLPTGATETGSWQTISNASKEASFPISFPIPLAAPLAAIHVIFVSVKDVKEGKISAGCSGTVEKPAATSGNLCVFEGFPEGMVGSHEIYATGTAPAPGAGTTGAWAFFEAKAAAAPLTGSWAVTGE